MKKEIDILKEGQESIQRELKEIKKLLRAIQAPTVAPFKEVVISVKDDPFKGYEKAKLALIEFSDYQ